MLEELLALGHRGAEYDAWLIKIGDGDRSVPVSSRSTPTRRSPR
jgi:hypothetical protein